LLRKKLTPSVRKNKVIKMSPSITMPSGTRESAASVRRASLDRSKLY
jgi:hypothetical protein